MGLTSSRVAFQVLCFCLEMALDEDVNLKSPQSAFKISKIYSCISTPFYFTWHRYPRQIRQILNSSLYFPLLWWEATRLKPGKLLATVHLPFDFHVEWWPTSAAKLWFCFLGRILKHFIQNYKNLLSIWRAVAIIRRAEPVILGTWALETCRTLILW